MKHISLVVIAIATIWLLVCVDDKFSEPFKSYLDKDAAYIFISSMTEERKYCSDVIKKTF